VTAGRVLVLAQKLLPVNAAIDVPLALRSSALASGSSSRPGRFPGLTPPLWDAIGGAARPSCC